MDIVCTACGSQQVQRVALAHAQSTSIVYDGRGKASALQKTATGVALAPPTKRRMVWRWGLFLLFLFTSITYLAQIIQAIFSRGAAVVITIVAEIAYIVATYAVWRYVVSAGRRYNSVVYPTEMARWERMWVCHQCGSIFDPEIN